LEEKSKEKGKQRVCGVGMAMVACDDGGHQDRCKFFGLMGTLSHLAAQRSTFESSAQVGTSLCSLA
jgi:hypothetical protein